MILEVDFGNTRLKWRILDSVTLACIDRGAVLQILELLPALHAKGYYRFVFCRVCSVRGCADNAQLSAVIKDGFGLNTVYARSFKQLAGVISGYMQPEKLGVDRWLAIVASYQQTKGASVVIDCGTAITVDFVTQSGRHLGGNIAPGLQLLSSMLKTGTQLMRDITEPKAVDNQQVGVSTETAVAEGVRSMFVGFIREQLNVARARLGDSFSVICTGGDSALVRSFFDDAIVDEDLVFIGLAIACPYREEEMK